MVNDDFSEISLRNLLNLCDATYAADEHHRMNAKKGCQMSSNNSIVLKQMDGDMAFIYLLENDKVFILRVYGL